MLYYHECLKHIPDIPGSAEENSIPPARWHKTNYQGGFMKN